MMIRILIAHNLQSKNEQQVPRANSAEECVTKLSYSSSCYTRLRRGVFTLNYCFGIDSLIISGNYKIKSVKKKRSPNTPFWRQNQQPDHNCAGTFASWRETKSGVFQVPTTWSPADEKPSFPAIFLTPY